MWPCCSDPSLETGLKTSVFKRKSAKYSFMSITVRNTQRKKFSTSCLPIFFTHKSCGFVLIVLIPPFPSKQQSTIITRAVCGSSSVIFHHQLFLFLNIMPTFPGRALWPLHPLVRYQLRSHSAVAYMGEQGETKDSWSTYSGKQS